MKFNWNNDGVYQYLDVVFDETEAIDQFTYNMICELPSGYLKCVKQSIDLSVFKYGLSGKRSLQHVIERHVSQVKMLTIIKRVAEQLLALPDYLIDIRQVYLSDQTVFIDVLTEEVQLLIVPTQQIDNFASMKQWLSKHIDTYRHTLYHGGLGLMLYNYIQSDQFCLAGLITLISEQIARNEKKHNIVTQNAPQPDKLLIRDDKKLKNKNKMTILPYMAILLLQVCLAVVYALIFLMLPKLTADLLLARTGALLILLSVDILFSRWLIKQFSISAFTIDKLPRIKTVKPSFKKDNQQVVAETTLLSTAKQEAYLFDVTTNKPYMLRANNTLIGRQQQKVDICLDSGAIGRKHCKIVKRDNGYWLTDLASKNGTFINGIQIAAKDIRQLSSGDKVRFADSEFVFINGAIMQDSRASKLNILQ